MKHLTYIPLYRKWRPQSFSDLVGQQHVSATLKNAIISGKLSHTYLFCGPRGTGKTSCARIFAKALNCPNTKEGEPCNICPSCHRITEGSSLDVQEMDAASHTQVDKVREFIIDRVNFAPVEGKYKVYIIDEAHKLSTASFDALLKTLEEPPPHIFFILATTHPQNLPPTILSRCQRHDFRKIPFKTAINQLARIARSEKYNTTEEALVQIVRLADGSLRDSLVIMEQAAAFSGGNITPDELSSLLGLTGEETLFVIAEKILDHDTPGALTVLHRILDEGKDSTTLARDLIGHFRNLLLIKACGEAKELLQVSRDTYERLVEQARIVDMGELIRYVRILGDMADELKDTSLASLPWEMALIKMTKRSADPGIESIHFRLKAIEEKMEGDRNKTTEFPSAIEKTYSKSAHLEVEKTPTEKPEKNISTGKDEEPLKEKSRKVEISSSELWSLILKDVKSKRPSLESALRECKNLEMNEDSMVLGIDGSNQ
ncbi:MAG: DNA polymerase III subunit gamma/tau, partial [Candidatus Eremiobacteraeota bacterium]|nr:DNA polymerase III subunit gamma/tau [Candidatus Eremiobacteraeota bacterium]